MAVSDLWDWGGFRTWEQRAAFDAQLGMPERTPWWQEQDDRWAKVIEPRIPKVPVRKSANEKSRNSAGEACAGASGTEVGTAASRQGERGEDADGAAPWDEDPSGSMSTRPATSKAATGPPKHKRYIDRGLAILSTEFRPGWLTPPKWRCAREGCRYSVNKSSLYGSWCCDYCYAVDVHGEGWSKKHNPETCNQHRDGWSEKQDLQKGPLYAPRVNQEWALLPEEYLRRKRQRQA